VHTVYSDMPTYDMTTWWLTPVDSSFTKYVLFVVLFCTERSDDELLLLRLQIWITFTVVYRRTSNKRRVPNKRRTL